MIPKGYKEIPMSRIFDDEELSSEKFKYRTLPETIILPNKRGGKGKRASKYDNIYRDLTRVINDGKEVSCPYIYTKYNVDKVEASRVIKGFRQILKEQGIELTIRKEGWQVYYGLGK